MYPTLETETKSVKNWSRDPDCATDEDERTVLYKTKSLDGTKRNTNPNPNLTQILTLFSCFMLFSSTVP